MTPGFHLKVKIFWFRSDHVLEFPFLLDDHTLLCFVQDNQVMDVLP